MITRKLDKKLFTTNVFLLGPRKVGKSTFLRHQFADSLYIDLLDNTLFLQYLQAPGKLYEYIMFEITNRPELRNLPIIIDEIQRTPVLLNEVHRLIESEQLRFILCGSSARKLVRGGSNMLGGRASRIEMRGLSLTEIENVDLIKFINNGAIPAHYLSDDPQSQIKAYIQNYLQEEIKGEALVRNLHSFNHFLELVGITHSEEVNYANIARDVGVDAKTIKEYFQILIDTLVGTYLEPLFDKQKRTNILKSPKFYLFDSGVVNYLKGITIGKPVGTDFGKAFEHVIYHELLNYKNYTQTDFEISFWRTYEQDEVDFIINHGEVALEVKGTSNVHSSHVKSLKKFTQIYQPKKKIVVSNEPQPRQTESGIAIMPYQYFVAALWNGDIV